MKFQSLTDVTGQGVTATPNATYTLRGRVSGSVVLAIRFELPSGDFVDYFGDVPDEPTDELRHETLSAVAPSNLVRVELGIGSPADKSGRAQALQCEID